MTADPAARAALRPGNPASLSYPSLRRPTLRRRTCWVSTSGTPYAACVLFLTLKLSRSAQSRLPSRGLALLDRKSNALVRDVLKNPSPRHSRPSPRCSGRTLRNFRRHICHASNVSRLRNQRSPSPAMRASIVGVCPPRCCSSTRPGRGHPIACLDACVCASADACSPPIRRSKPPSEDPASTNPPFPFPETRTGPCQGARQLTQVQTFSFFEFGSLVNCYLAKAGATENR
jgi:hypothetical protein